MGEQDGLHGLDQPPWPDLHHAYGAATDIPDLLRTVATEPGEAARQAVSRLWNNLNHQGSVYPATVAAVPFLLRLAQQDHTARVSLLTMIATIARSGFHIWDTGHRLFHDPDYLDDTVARRTEEADFHAFYPALREQVLHAVPVAGRLLDDPDPAMRAAAAYLLAGCPAHTTHLVTHLRERVGSDPDPVVRASLVLAGAQIAARAEPTGGHHPPDQLAEVTDWARHLTQDTDAPAEVRLASTAAALDAVVTSSARSASPGRSGSMRSAWAPLPTAMAATGRTPVAIAGPSPHAVEPRVASTVECRPMWLPRVPASGWGVAHPATAAVP